MKTDKEIIQKEILDLLDETIDNEMSAMLGHYTCAEVSKEVLLSWISKYVIRRT